MPRSLAMSNYLYRYWASVTNGIVGQAGREQVRRAMVASAKTSYGDGETLGVALSEDEPRALGHLVRPIDEGADPSSVLSDAGDWHWLVPFLLDAAKAKGEIVVQTIWLILDRKSTSAEQYTLDLDFAERLFGDRLPEVMTLIANAQSTGREPEAHSEIINMARTQAQVFLSKLSAK
jgi:hypothetical protein